MYRRHSRNIVKQYKIEEEWKRRLERINKYNNKEKNKEKDNVNSM